MVQMVAVRTGGSHDGRIGDGRDVVAVHCAGQRRAHSHEEQRIVGDLVDVFMADNPKPSSALENVFLDDWREAGCDGERLRVAIDQVASLTDTSALTLHSLLC